MAAQDNRKRLEAAGLSGEKIPESYRAVLESLTPEEVDTMIRIRERLAAAGEGDVQGYAKGAGDDVGFFYY